MHKLASLNHQIKPAEEFHLPFVSSAALYGRSVFTTLAVYRSTIFQWRKHWRRISENALRLKIDLSKFSEEQVEHSIYDLIAVNNFQNGRVRLTFFDESAGGLWSHDAKNNSSVLITSADFKITSSDLRLTTSPFSVNSKSPLANLKSGNYLENILALENCRSLGFDEAVRLNEKKQVVSGVMANLFWVSDKTIYTAPLETGGLQGTTREFVTENFPVAERFISLAELNSADEIFLTSAGLGIAQVTNLEEKFFDDFSVSGQVQRKFNDAIRNLTRQTKIP